MNTDPQVLDNSSGYVLMEDYTVGDGTANDTAGAQAAINAAIAQQQPLHSQPGRTYSVEPLSIGGELTLVGAFVFKARTPRQACVLTFVGKQNWTGATVEVHGAAVTA